MQTQLGLDRNLANVGQVCNLRIRRKWLIHSRLQTCPTLPGLLAFRKISITVLSYGGWQFISVRFP